MEEAVEVVAGVNVFMYVWKAVHGGGGLAGWRLPVLLVRSTMDQPEAQTSPRHEFATQKRAHIHTQTHTDISSLQCLYMLTNKH